MRKGIILAGGKGTRLRPLTNVISKQLLHVYDKPMIYYSLSILMLTNIREILIISTPVDLPLYKSLFRDGSDFGISISYKEQLKPRGLPEAFVLAEDFLQRSASALVLGDNIFFSMGLQSILEKASENITGMGVFAYPVCDPREYGVVKMNTDGKIVSIEEKPLNPKSNLALTGLYFCDNQATSLAKDLKLSARGEFEIIDLMNRYLEKNQLVVNNFGRGAAWFDTGNPDSLLDAANFISTIERRQGLKVACLEEIAFNKNWITLSQIKEHAKKYDKSSYGRYLKNLINEFHG